MFKKIIAIALTLAVISCMAIVAVSAAEVSDSAVGAEVNGSAAGADSSSSASGGSGDLIYFDANGWKNFTSISCHIYEIGGKDFFGWGNSNEACDKDKGTVFKYDLSKLASSTNISGGMKKGGKYAVLFYANTGVQTYDTTIGVECKGDTIYLTGEKIENPVDSEKKTDEAVWENNSGKYGPHLAITSIGNIVGSKLAPGEGGIEVIGEWTAKYFNSTHCKAVDVLAKAYPKFGIKTGDDLTAAYAIAQAKIERGDISTADKNDLPDVLKKMNAAFAKAYPSQKGTTIDKDKADKTAKDIESGKTSVTSVGQSGSTGSSTTGGSGSAGSSGAGSTDGGGSYGGGDSSGSGADGQETTIFFVLGGVMIAAAGAMFISRKRKED